MKLSVQPAIILRENVFFLTLYSNNEFCEHLKFRIKNFGNSPSLIIIAFHDVIANIYIAGLNKYKTFSDFRVKIFSLSILSLI
jgi:hypothetical protein